MALNIQLWNMSGIIFNVQWHLQDSAMRNDGRGAAGLSNVHLLVGQRDSPVLTKTQFEFLFL